MKTVVIAVFLIIHAPSVLAEGTTAIPSLNFNWESKIQKQVDAQGSTITRIQKQADAQASKTAEIQKQVGSLSLSVQDVRIPTGAIVAFYGDKAPEGWLLCDGSIIPNDYKDLRKLVGERLPDLRGVFARGVVTSQSPDKGDSETGRLINYIMKI